MSECRGPGCTHPDHLKRPQFGSSMHFPDCIDSTCTGCVPPESNPPVLPAEPASTVDELRRRLVDELRDPVVKYDGAGQPVRASQLPGNRAQRRAAAREARRRR